MSTLNFDEFEQATFAHWQQLLTKELGNRTADSLDWNVSGDVVMGPYPWESSESFAMEGLPGWEMLHGPIVHAATHWNSLAHEALMGGCNSLRIRKAPASAAELETMLRGIFVEYIALHIDGGDNVNSIAQWFVALCAERGVNSKELRGAFLTSHRELSDADIKSLINFTKEQLPRFRIFAIDATVIHESGGNALQEIAYALTEGHALLVRCMDAGLSVDDAAALVQFNFATGSSYFTEIAKYRAFRWAWKSIVEQYKPQYGCSIHTYIAASTSRYFQTAKDSHTNLLRATTQAMSAVIGGVNSLLVEPYNGQVHEADASALRWSRNIQQLLTEESYFESYRAAANGSHYVEQLTGKVLRAGWALFQRWDALRAVSGIEAFDAQWKLEVGREDEASQKALAEGHRIMVGVNKYVNKSDSSVVAQSAKTFTASLEQA